MRVDMEVYLPGTSRRVLHSTCTKKKNFFDIHVHVYLRRCIVVCLMFDETVCRLTNYVQYKF